MTGTRRALLLTMDMPPTRGGIQTMTREILMRARRTSFRTVAPADPGHRAHDTVFPHPIRRVPRVAPGRRGYAPTIAIAALAEIRGHRPEVALSMHSLAAPGALLGRVPTVVVCHGGELRSPRIRALARRVLPRAERVIANSRYTRSLAIALGAEPMNVTVIPVGAPEPVPVARERVEALRARFGGARIVLSVARLEPHKGHDALIEALAPLPEDVVAVIVGRGSAEEDLRALADARGVGARVVFAGEVEDAELPVYFSAADAFALLSRETAGARAGVEGGGIALLEACAYALPIVAGNTGGIPETIHDGENGLLVAPEDPEAVARALRRLLEDAELGGRLGEAARAMATGERSWDAFVARVEDVLEAAAARRREPAA